MYKFSDNSPKDSPSELWKLQGFLLSEIEGLIGRRDINKIIYQPAFNDEGPFICVPHDGAYAVLSPNSKSSWGVALYELAHETVHLLDPVAGNTNILEEGVATRFSEEMSKKLAGCAMSTSMSSYREAEILVGELPKPFYNSVRLIREKVGALSKVTKNDLVELFPDISEEVASTLCETFIR